MQNYPHHLKALLVDFDGTLANSLSSLWECYRTFLENNGKKATEKEFKSLLAPSLIEIVRILKEAHSLEGSVEKLYLEYWQLARQAYEQKVEVFNDAVEILKKSHAMGLKVALVTSAPLDLVDIFLNRFNLQNAFHALITSSLGEPTKPSPALYLRALSTLQIRAEEALAVEDSLGGVKSASEAGIYTIQFYPANSRSSLSPEASIFVGSWFELGEAIQGYQTFKLAPNFSPQVVNSREEIKLSDLVEGDIDCAWNCAQKQKSGKLFNGRLYNFLSFERGVLLGTFVEYKHYMAQLIDPSLKSQLHISPVAISCICLSKGKVLLGRRSQDVTDFPNCFELAPSGGIDPIVRNGDTIDIRRQAMIELEEEAGIPPSEIQECFPFLLIKDLKLDSYEICMLIKLKEQPLRLKSEEYVELRWLDSEELKVYAQKMESKFVPVSLFLINNYCHFQGSNGQEWA